MGRPLGWLRVKLPEAAQIPPLAHSRSAAHLAHLKNQVSVFAPVPLHCLLREKKFISCCSPFGRG